MPTIDPQLWAALRPLLDKALDLEAGARQEWLDDLRQDSPQVVRHLERLLVPEGEMAVPAPPVARTAPALTLRALGFQR